MLDKTITFEYNIYRNRGKQERRKEMEEVMTKAALISFLEAIKKIAEKNEEPKTVKDIEDLIKAAKAEK